MFLVAGGATGAIVIDPIAIENNPGAIPNNPLFPAVMNPVPTNRNIVPIVDLDAIVPIPYVKPFDRDPAYCIPITSIVLNKNLMIRSSSADKLNDRKLARNVEEFDRSRLGTGSSKSDRSFFVCPALDVGRISSDHFGHGIGHSLPWLGTCAWIAIVPSRSDIVRRRVGDRRG